MCTPFAFTKFTNSPNQAVLLQLQLARSAPSASATACVYFSSAACPAMALAS